MALNQTAPEEESCNLENPHSQFYSHLYDSDKYFTCVSSQFTNGSRKYVLSLTPFALCDYVRNVSYCEGGGYIPWSEAQFCTYDDTPLQTIILIGSVVIFVYLFILLSTTADDFFCSNIATIIDTHKISQNVAGITFMAFGNGAPDIFTSLASVVSVEEPQHALAISELLGGGIFIITVVVSAIVLTQPFDVMRRPIIRDLAFYAFPIMILAVTMVNRGFKIIEPVLFLVIYIIYAFTVISGGFVHRRMSKRKERRLLHREAILKVSGFTPEPLEKRKRGRSSSAIFISRARIAPADGIRKLTTTDLIVNDDRLKSTSSRKSSGSWRSVSAMADNRRRCADDEIRIVASQDDGMVPSIGAAPYDNVGKYDLTAIQTDHITVLFSTENQSPTSSKDSGTNSPTVGPSKKLVIAVRSKPSDESDGDTPARAFLESGKFFGKPKLDDDEESDSANVSANDFSTILSSADTDSTYNLSPVSKDAAYLEEGRGTRADSEVSNSRSHVRHVSVVAPDDNLALAFPRVNYGSGSRSAKPHHKLQRQRLFSHHNLDLMPSENRLDEGMCIQMLKRISPIKPKQFLSANYISKMFQIIKIPCALVLNITVPLAEEQWSKPLALLQTALCPLLFIFSFQFHNQIEDERIRCIAVTCCGVAVVVFGMIILIFTSWRHTPRYYAIISAYAGFAASIAWIYWAASEVVSIVIMFGNVLGISNQVLGLTAVAWSNCIGDMVADISVARKGFPRMAFSAAIGGPLFNILVGFGATFTITFLKTHEEITFDRPDDTQIIAVITVMLATLTISLLATLTILFFQKFRMRRENGIFLIFIYMIFIVTAILLNNYFQLDVKPIYCS